MCIYIYTHVRLEVCVCIKACIFTCRHVNRTYFELVSWSPGEGSHTETRPSIAAIATEGEACIEPGIPKKRRNIS